MSVPLTRTTAADILATLIQARRRMGGTVRGMVLTLVIVTDDASWEDALRAARDAGREHPSRVLVAVAEEEGSEPRLDAEIRVGDGGADEVVLLRVYGELCGHLESVVGPLLLADSPVVAWWPGQAPDNPAADPLGALAGRRITDAAASTAPLETLIRRAARYTPGDTDFAWTRLTPWRTVLAAAFDQPFQPITSGVVAGEANNASADLLASWLSVGFDVPVDREVSEGPGITAVRLRDSAGRELAVTRPDGRMATLSLPDQPQRPVALTRRGAEELLAEELRRLDPDEVYEECVKRLRQEPSQPGREIT